MIFWGFHKLAVVIEPRNKVSQFWGIFWGKSSQVVVVSAKESSPPAPLVPEAWTLCSDTKYLYTGIIVIGIVLIFSICNDEELTETEQRI